MGDDALYDGNGDGTPDWRQEHVVSFHTYGGDGTKHYTTLAVPLGQWVAHVEVRSGFEVPPPEGVGFPYGFFSFRLGGVPVGGSTTATLYLDGPAPQTYYKYGRTPDTPADHWYEFTFDGRTGAEATGKTVVLHFEDGMRGDHDLEANGMVLDPGGPAEIAPHAGLYFPYLVSMGEAGGTEIGIVNTKGYATASTISYYGEDGDLLKSAAVSLRPYGKEVISSGSMPRGSASAIVTGDGDPVGYTRYVDALGKRSAWCGATVLHKGMSVAHTAVGPEWGTSIVLFNPNEESAEAALGYEGGSRSAVTVGPRSRKVLRLTESEAVVSISSSAYLCGVELFDSRILGGDAGGLLLGDRYLGSLQVPWVLSGSGEFTGVGLTSHYSGKVHVEGWGMEGVLSREVWFGTQPLGSESVESRMALDLSGMLGSGSSRATLSGEADFATPFGTPLLQFQGVGVYGQEGTRKLGAVNLNGLRFREGFLGIAGGEASVFLVNPGSSEATVSVTGLGAAGEVLSSGTLKIGAGCGWRGAVGGLIDGGLPATVTHVRLVSDADLYGIESVSENGRMEILPVMGRN